MTHRWNNMSSQLLYIHVHSYCHLYHSVYLLLGLWHTHARTHTHTHTHQVLHLLHSVERHGDQRDQHKHGGGDPHQLCRDRWERLLHQVPDLPPGRPQGHVVKQLLVLLHLHLSWLEIMIIIKNIQPRENKCSFYQHKKKKQNETFIKCKRYNAWIYIVINDSLRYLKAFLNRDRAKQAQKENIHITS